MRRLSILLAIVVTAMVAITGVALADTIDCISGRVCIGTDGPDTLNGSSRHDKMDARQGNDQLFGHSGYDALYGDARDAPDSSTDGNDRLGGGQDYDELYGYGGNDKLLGRSGGDFIFAEERSENEGEDVVRGEEGNDWILARDGVKDTILCGKGKYDGVRFDKGIDTVSNSCEYKRGGVYSAASTSGATEEVSAAELEALRAR